MARPKGIVLESMRSLRELEERHEGTPLEQRVRMLRFLKEKPNRTLSDIGTMIGMSERSVQRWWETYQKTGLEGLMKVGRRGGRARRLDALALESLQQKLHIEGFSGLKDIQAWLRDEYNVEYSRSGLWSLLRTTAKAAPRGWMLIPDEPGTYSRRFSHVSATSGIPTHVVNFLNALPTTADSVEWGLAFREALRIVLADIDRISINVNLDCNLSDPGSYIPAQSMIQPISSEAVPDGKVAVQSESHTNNPSERILEEIRRQGLPLHEYHKPYSYDYYYGGQAYLGSIILWREVKKPTISNQTLAAMADLEPFLLFALSDLVARHQAEKPIDRIFHDALEDLFADADLTPQEGRVVVLQLMGHSYKEMADVLSVTVDTVKKHFKQIHRKTRTRSQSELFAKYFSSRLIPEKLQQWQDDEP